MFKQDEYLNPKPPIKLLVFSFLEYIAPLLGWVFLVIIGGYYDYEAAVTFFKGSFFGFYFWFALVVPVVAYYYFTNIIRNEQRSRILKIFYCLYTWRFTKCYCRYFF